MLRVDDGRVSCQDGARLHDIELAARETGQMLRMGPSTWRVATVAGFISGGFGGIGSTRHGGLLDSGNLCAAERRTRVALCCSRAGSGRLVIDL